LNQPTGRKKGLWHRLSSPLSGSSSVRQPLSNRLKAAKRVDNLFEPLSKTLILILCFLQTLLQVLNSGGLLLNLVLEVAYLLRIGSGIPAFGSPLNGLGR
jgi:hypothetical protein